MQTSWYKAIFSTRLKEGHARALFEGFVSPADAIEPTTICAREAIAVGDRLDNRQAVATGLHLAHGLQARQIKLAGMGQADLDRLGAMATALQPASHCEGR